MRAAALVGTLVVAPLVAAGQPVFKAGVDLVRIPVNVTQGGTPVEPGVLSAADFIVSENGQRQQVSLFEREALPLSICIAFDTSLSMLEGPTDDMAIASLRQLLTRLMPEDEVAVVAFDAETQLVTPWTPAPKLTAARINFKAGGGTSLHDGVMKAMEVLDAAHNPRRVILLITDGGENSSKTKLERMVTTRRESETLVYAFHIAPEVTKPPPPRFVPGSGIDQVAPPAPVAPAPYHSPLVLAPMPPTMEDLVGDSGGVVYRVRTKDDSATMPRALVEDLRFQYTVGYTPSKAMDGKYRRVKVEVGKRGYKVRHRGGYLALPSGTRE